MTFCAFASVPTIRPPPMRPSMNAMTDGWTVVPASSASTLTRPSSSSYATTEFEVPRSIPTIVVSCSLTAVHLVANAGGGHDFSRDGRWVEHDAALCADRLHE